MMNKHLYTLPFSSNRIVSTLIIAIGFGSQVCYAQANDSIVVLKLEAVFRSMLLYHPVVKQAKLLTEQAKQELLIARGTGFDPKIQSTLDYKSFDGKEYFSIWQNALKIPTWFGADFKVGYDEMYGTYLNPQNYIPSNGLSYVGVSVPIGQGLIMDQRRAVLRQAQAFQQINEAEKIKTINKISFEVAKDYWEWYFRYQRYQNLEMGIDLATKRYEFVKSRAKVGEEATIDTTEALVLLQTRSVTYSQAEMELQNAALQLSNHTWGENDTPLEIDSNTRPEIFILSINKITKETLEELVANAKINHPEITKINFKLKQLEIERRLSVENLKPTINLNYNVLSRGKFQNFESGSSYFQNNAKYGFDISMPLFLRKERGKLLLTKAKIKQTNFERSYTARQIQNEIFKYYNELVNTEKLIDTQKNLVNNYVRLRDGELEKFNNGESSLFLVNSRETNLIDTQVKLAEMEAKYEKAKAGLYWAAGKTEF